MGKQENTPKTININDVEYNVDDLSPEQIELVNHVLDLDRKLGSAQFNVTQLQGGRAFFMSQLEGSLKEVT